MTPTAGKPARLAQRVPPHAYFVTSAVFHYLGPSFAVLLFARVGVLGVVAGCGSPRRRRFSRSGAARGWC
ncbi:hypothetical protein [Fodinicola feengrottensis]|uniref:hypothetical protein n=1 Tax=Fodinicola feengrottensis TaxID=435914 RepID=UPI002441E69F|nr:hypothetical protein [Fodinicola feengrottensis]